MCNDLMETFSFMHQITARVRNTIERLQFALGIELTRTFRNGNQMTSKIGRDIILLVGGSCSRLLVDLKGLFSTCFL